MEPMPPLPPELIAYRGVVNNYVNARIRHFAGAFVRRLNLPLNGQQLDSTVQDTLTALATQDLNTGRSLRLVLRHDCQSTGCGDSGCLLCQYNPSRLCKRNIKNKYLIDDSLKAKCGAPLRVELVDENNACVLEGLPAGMQLECLVMNGEKYKEICPDNTLLTHSQLRTCIISHHQRALLRREGGSDDQLRCFLQLERGQVVLSDLQVTTSSEALLAGKAPTFRLLIWATDANGEPVPSVTYVVSEYFVVATKRVKHAIKSDIPSVADHVSKLVHIGKATVDKLLDLRTAAREEGFDIQIPDELNRVDKVGTFQQLVELTEMNTDLKNKVRHLLKLSPEKWEEVATHAQSAVVPDFRHRAWWCPALKAGLLFACKNGAVSMDQPIALIKMAANKGEEDQVIPVGQLDVQLFNTIPKLKAQALQSWYAQSHPGWAIYYKEGQADANSPLLASNGGGLPATRDPSQPGSATAAGALLGGGNVFAGAHRLSTSSAPPPGGAANVFASPSPVGRLSTPPPNGLPATLPLGGLSTAVALTQPKIEGLSPFSGFPSSLQAPQPPPQAAGQLPKALPLPGALPGSNPGSLGGAPSTNPSAGGASKSPFAVPGLMGGLQDHFPQWPNGQAAGVVAAAAGTAAVISNDSLGVSLLLNQLGNSLAGNSLQVPGSGAAVLLPGTAGAVGGMDGVGAAGARAGDGISAFNSLLGAEGPSAAWGAGQLPISMLGGSGSMNGSLNQTINALIQEQVERANSLEPPTKIQRTMVAEEAGGL